MRRLITRLVVMLALASFALTTNCFPPLLTTIAGELAVPLSLFGWLFALQYAMFAAAAFSSGILKRRIGAPNRTFVLVGLATLSAVLLGAPVFAGLRGLVLMVVLLGIAGGLVESHGSVVVSELDRTRSAQYLNLSQAFFCIGGIVAPSTVALLFHSDLSWQQILAVLGAIAALVAVAFGIVATRGGERPAGLEERPPQVKAEKRAPRRFTLSALSLLMFLYTFSESTIVSWLPSLLQVARSLSRGDAAGMLGSFWLGVMVARFAMFFYPVRRPVAAVIAVALVVCGGGVAAMWSGAGGALLPPLVVLIGLGFGPLWPSIVAVSREADRESDLTVRVVAVGGIGAATGPIVSSRIIRTAGIASVQTLLLVVIGLELVCFALFVIVRSRRRDRMRAG